jgi:4-diphosphocytidyl-2-C-methyl-D-erythritol kinase
MATAANAVIPKLIFFIFFNIIEIICCNLAQIFELAKFVKKMLLFPNCKINIGLNITQKYPNGYHALETVFYPIDWTDILEVNEKTNQPATLTINQSGIKIDGKTEDNILYKAYNLLSEVKTLPNLSVHLHKILPMGAGLGGGSSDAAFFINHLNTTYELGLSLEELNQLASKLGADCAFFITNKPVYATGIGNVFENITLDLNKYYICLVYPNIHSNTKVAYSNVIPKQPSHNLKNCIETLHPKDWKNSLQNDFEESVFLNYPEIKELKNYLYQQKALYASMSGSGSAIYGIFDAMPQINLPSEYLMHIQLPNE